MRTASAQRARDGDEDAFTQLVDLDGDRCFAIAYRILRDVDRAKDAVQQTYLVCGHDGDGAAWIYEPPAELTNVPAISEP